MRAEG